MIVWQTNGNVFMKITGSFFTLNSAPKADHLRLCTISTY